MAAVLKIDKSQYFGNGLTECQEIWYGDPWSYWPYPPNQQLKLQTFKKSKMEEIVISQQQYDWSQWNMTRCCTLHLWILLAVKISNF